MNTRVPHHADPEFAETIARLWQIGVWSVFICALGVALQLGVGGPLRLHGALDAWATLTVAIVFQAAPFLVAGVVVSAVLAVLVPDSVFLRAGRAGVPGMAAAGVILPGCECSAVPVAATLMRRGVPASGALAFMLASPAINPVVLIATAVAFPDAPAMAWARLAAGLVAACIVGWAWQRVGVTVAANSRHDRHEHHRVPGEHRWRHVAGHIVDDFASAGGYLVVGAMIAATLKVLLPAQWLETLARQPLLAIAAMAMLAIIMSVCSEADAFIAASFVGVSPVAQLVFLTVGPMVDLKLVAMQWGVWGRRFVLRFVPLALVGSVGGALAVGLVAL